MGIYWRVIIQPTAESFPLSHPRPGGGAQTNRLIGSYYRVMNAMTRGVQDERRTLNLV